MSALSKKVLIDKITSDELVVSPILSADQIDSCSIDLRLGNIAKMVRASSISHVDPKPNHVDDIHIEQAKRQKLERHDVPFQEQFLLHTGSLVLVPTLEWIKLPHNLQGIVTARSTWAREGLSIATATFIQPGYMGIVTLELANLGQIPIALYPGLRVAQIAFYEVNNTDSDTKPSQFNMSFEPDAGDLSKGDECFLNKDGHIRQH